MAEDREPVEELSPAVDDYIPGSAELAVVDPQDRHEAMLRMDDHDVRMLLEQVQKSALRKWVYELEAVKEKNPATGRWEPVRGLTVHAVQDITQRMNWTGKCSIGVDKDSLTVERITEDAGHGPEPFWVATIFAVDGVTGTALPGSSMEPVRMRLKAETARRKRDAGMQIPEDNTVFDPFSRTKAIQKATRNALDSFIPAEIKQTVIAMFAQDPSRVERIRSEAEQKVEDLPPALTDERAQEQVARARELYAEIRELGGGRGKVEVTPGHFNAYLTAAQHDHDRLDDFLGWLEQRREQITAKYAEATS